MPRQDGRIEPGQKLSSAISARAWNRAQQAADIVLGSVPGAAAEPATYTSSPYTWVYGKNITSATVPRWGVVSIAGVEIIPTANDSAGATRQFEQMPVLTLNSLTSSQQRCVAIEPIAGGSIGRVAVAGAVQVKAADLDNLPNVIVLYKDANWAIVRFGFREAVRLGTISATWNKGDTATVTQIYGDGTEIPGNPTFEAYNHFVDITVPTGTKNVACGYVDGVWILIAAECD